MLDNSTLVWDTEQVHKISQRFSTSLDPVELATLATEGLMEYFDCAFVRIWLVEPDQKMLKLVASSGLYTQTNGAFSQIPIGAFKIGKIAQHRISLLSNQLPQESWVRDPDWAIANHIYSFAGYPLATPDRVIGVLAVFGYAPMSAEFIKVLSTLCTTLSVALALAAQHQQQTLSCHLTQPKGLLDLSLSENLAYILGSTTLSILGTERDLEMSQTQIFLKLAEILKTLDCSYCRLTYEDDSVSLDAIAAVDLVPEKQQEWEQSRFGQISLLASFLGGFLKVTTEKSIKVIQVSLMFSSQSHLNQDAIQIQCSSPFLQTGLTQLAYMAGLNVCTRDNRQSPLLTDQVSLLDSCDRILWVNVSSRHPLMPLPTSVKAQLDVSLTAEQLQEAVKQVAQGGTWGLHPNHSVRPKLSSREQEVMSLLVKGLRDRDIAEQLYISDSTVKFHINNIVTKLEAKTRLQALYTLMQTHGDGF